MAQYNLSHTGQQLDAAVEKYLQVDFNSLVVNTTLNNYVTTTALSTTLENYLSVSNAANTYLSISTAANTYIPLKQVSDTGKFLRGDNTWSNILNTTEAGITGDTGAYIHLKVIHQTTGIECGVAIDDNGSNHGIWSNGYSDGTTFTDDATWIIFRGCNGEVVIPRVMYTNRNGCVPCCKMSDAENITALINDVRYSQGQMGSVCITTASHNVSTGWYNYLYIPHRAGLAGSDNHLYGTLLLFYMTSNNSNFLMIHYTNGTINNAIAK